jgi:hypothetical protein
MLFSMKLCFEMFGVMLMWLSDVVVLSSRWSCGGRELSERKNERGII